MYLKIHREELRASPSKVFNDHYLRSLSRLIRRPKISVIGKASLHNPN